MVLPPSAHPYAAAGAVYALHPLPAHGRMGKRPGRDSVCTFSNSSWPMGWSRTGSGRCCRRGSPLCGRCCRLNAEIRDGRSACLEFNTAVERQDFPGLAQHRPLGGRSLHGGGGERPLPPALPAPALHGRRHPGRLPPPSRTTAAASFPAGPGAPPPGAGDSPQGVLQLHLRLGLRHSRRSWPRPRQDPPRHPHGAEDRLPPPALTAENAAAILCDQVLGAYRVAFRR